MPSHIVSLIVTSHAERRERRIVAFDVSPGQSLCVACALDHFGEELIRDPLGVQSAFYSPVFEHDVEAVNRLTGEVCYGTLAPADHRVLPGERPAVGDGTARLDCEDSHG